MTPAERLEVAAERFADTLNEAIAVRVQAALALERDRHDAELAELRRELTAIRRSLDLHADTFARLHSVKVEP